MAEPIVVPTPTPTPPVPPAVDPINPDLNASEMAKLKELITKANAEAAEYKRKYTASLDEDTRKQKEQEEANKVMAEKLATLERKDALSTASNAFLGIGLTADEAKVAAAAFQDQKLDKISEVIKNFATRLQKEKEEALLNATPIPPDGNNGKPIQSMDNMSMEQCNDLKKTNPALYNQLLAQIGQTKPKTQ